MSQESNKPFGLPTAMGEVMATLLMIVDAWYELAREMAPQRYEPSDRVEVLAQLTRLLAVRFHGFRRLPKPDQVSPILGRDNVGLRIRSPGRVPAISETIERELQSYGFRAKRDPASNGRELLLTCSDLTGARVIPFPTAAVAAKRRST